MKMPSNRRASTKSNLQTLTLTPFLATSDEDDDFQNPSEAITITQNLILSSLTNPSSHPPRPSNAARPRKRTKTSAAAIVKENDIISQPRSSDCRVSIKREDKKTIQSEMSGIPAPIASGSVAIPSVLTSCPCASTDTANTGCSEEVDTVDGNSRSENKELAKLEKRDLSLQNGSGSVEISATSGTDSFVSQFGATVECDGEETNGRASLLEPRKDSKLIGSCGTDGSDSNVLKGCSNSWGLKEGNGSYYVTSLESRLLESRDVLCDVHDVCLDGDGSGDTELGTQLNELVELCCNMGEEDGSSYNASLLERNYLSAGSSKYDVIVLVECPLCGGNITGLSEEMRQVHTNDCLDKNGTPEESVRADDINPSLCREIVSANPVVEWLRILGLSRYEEAFIREQIDWETLQWLTEEDLLSIGVDALGPRKKIVHALNELRKKDTQNEDRENDVHDANIDRNIKTHSTGNKLITQYFDGSANNRRKACSVSEPLQKKARSKDPVCKSMGNRNYTSKAKVKDIPSWCCIPGTPFRVDAFRFLRGDCSHWFLTHFHTDHYQGLTRNFCHGKIYCSSVTARLVNMKIGVSWDRLHILPLNQKLVVAGVSLTCMDANHCPGSIIILFEPPNGKAVLHTGDFRFSDEMISFPALQSCHVHTLILDTTYCNPQYDFPQPEAVIQFVIDAIQAEAFNPKTLFLIGTYTIGKEKLFLEVARLLRKKIYVGSAKLSLLRCLDLPEEDLKWFTANEMESHIHVVPMWTIASFKRMKYISNQYSDRFNLIVAFSPTGWTFGKGKKKTPGRRWQQGTIIRYEVPYSEHCSFSELREFVQFMSPDCIIPSVNNDSPESADAMIALLISDP